MLNFNHLHYFHIVAREGSISGAAAKLGLSQATVSEQVRNLERALEVRLFTREGGRLTLTEAGRLAYEHTTVMFRAGERLVESLTTDEDKLPHLLRVGLSTAVSRATTTEFLMPLFAIESCVPSIQSGDGADLLRQLRERSIDLVLIEGEPTDAAKADLVTALIDTTSLVAVAPKDVTPAPNWDGVGLLHYRASSAFRWEVEAFLDKGSLRPKIVGEADDPTFLLEVAIRGGFIAIVPRSIARDALRTNRVRVLAEVEASHSGIHAVYLDGESAKFARRAVDVLIDHAKLLNAA